MFGKRINRQENRVKIILEGEEEYIEAVQKMRKEEEMHLEVIRMLNEALESQIGIVHKLRDQSLEEQEDAEDHEQWLLNEYYSHKIIELLKKPMKIEGICTNEKEQLISCTRLVKILKHTISVVKSKPVNFWYDEEL